MASEAQIQAIARFVVGFGTEQDDKWHDYNLDFAGRINYDANGNPTAFHPVGNSGYSLGSLQWDFGQGTGLAEPFIGAFEAWIATNPGATPLVSTPSFAATALALDGDALTADASLGLRKQDVQALSEFVRSDGGSDWVNKNIDMNLIGNDQQPKVVVGGQPTTTFTLINIARKVEATASFTNFAQNHNDDGTNLIYAIGMKTYNQSPHTYTSKLLPFLATVRKLTDVADWYKQFDPNGGTHPSNGLFSGVGAATTLSQFWAKWRSSNGGPILAALENEMTTQCLADPRPASRASGSYMLAKQMFENTARFDRFTQALKNNTDFVDPNLFDLTTGKIKLSSTTGLVLHGLLVKKRAGYVWDAAGNAFKFRGNTWTAFPIAQINSRNL